MNEEPDNGKLRGFADADLVRRRRSLFNFAQASSLPIPNQSAADRKGGCSSRPFDRISRLLLVLRNHEVLRNRTHKRTRLSWGRLVSIEDGFERNVSPIQRASPLLILR
jgi:hypothetical protein